MVFINWRKKTFQQMKRRDKCGTYDEVYPEVQDIGGIEVGASGQPFRTKGHPPAPPSVTRIFEKEVSREEPYPP